MIKAVFDTMRANEKCRGDASTSHGVAHSCMRGTNMAIVSERASSVQSCQVCGGPSKNKNGCSKACRLKVNYIELTCKACGGKFHRNKKRHSRKAGKFAYCPNCVYKAIGQPRAEVSCSWCSATLIRASADAQAGKQFYCDADCQSKHLVVLAGGPEDGIRKCLVCGEPAQRKDGRGYHDHCENHKPVYEPVEYEKQCVYCRSSFVTVTGTQLYCSKSCYAAHIKPADKSVSCAWCDKPMTIGGNDNRRRFCSEPCNNRFKKKIRRARQAGATVEPVSLGAIAKRDSYQCMLCGGPVDMAIVYPHPHSPTIDHITPLSKGGEHSMQNVQLAHATCNLHKSAKLGAV